MTPKKCSARIFLARLLALTLTVNLSVASPVSALRPLNAGMEEGSPVNAELEAAFHHSSANTQNSMAGAEEFQSFVENLAEKKPVTAFGWDFLEDVAPGKSKPVLELLERDRVVVRPAGGSPDQLQLPVNFSGSSQTRWHNPFSKPSQLKLAGQAIPGANGPEVLTAEEEAAIHRRLAEVTLLNDLLHKGGDTSIAGLARAFSYDGDDSALALILIGRDAVPELFKALLEDPANRPMAITTVLKSIHRAHPDLGSFHDQAIRYIQAVDEWDAAHLKSRSGSIVRQITASKMSGGMQLLSFVEPRPEAVELLTSIAQRYSSAQEVFDWLKENAARMGPEAKEKAIAWLKKTYEEYRTIGVPSDSSSTGRLTLRDNPPGIQRPLVALTAIAPNEAQALAQPKPDPIQQAIKKIFDPTQGFGEDYGRQLVDYIARLSSQRQDRLINDETLFPAVADTLNLLNKLLDQDEAGHIRAAYPDLTALRFRIVLGALSFHDEGAVFGIAQTEESAETDAAEQVREGQPEGLTGVPREKLQPLDSLYALQSVIKMLLRGGHSTVKIGTLQNEPDNIPAILTGAVYYTLREIISSRDAARPALTRESLTSAAIDTDALAQIPTLHSNETLADVAKRLRETGVTASQINTALAAFTWMNGSANYDTNYNSRVDAWFENHRQRYLSSIPAEVADDIRLAIVSVYYEPSYVARSFDLAQAVGARLENYLKAAGLEEVGKWLQGLPLWSKPLETVQLAQLQATGRVVTEVAGVDSIVRLIKTTQEVVPSAEITKNRQVIAQLGLLPDQTVAALTQKFGVVQPLPRQLNSAAVSTLVAQLRQLDAQKPKALLIVDVDTAEQLKTVLSEVDPQWQVPAIIVGIPSGLVAATNPEAVLTYLLNLLAQVDSIPGRHIERLEATLTLDAQHQTFFLSTGA